MRVYKVADFEEWADDEGLTDTVLAKTVREINEGLIDANLGGGLYKKRIARTGQGKSGGYRTLIALKKDERLFFIYGFSKNEQENISIVEKTKFKKLANSYLSLSDEVITKLLKQKALMEIIL